MRTILILTACMCLAAGALAGSIVVQKAGGDVSVRHGVTEGWTTVAVGDVLRPNDTMRTGKDGNAVLVLQGMSGTSVKRLSLPAMVIVDMSDIRDLTQEELMLKLTMEKVRSSPEPTAPERLQIPDAGVVHGTDAKSMGQSRENDPQIGRALLNGTKVLCDNGFYATGVLRVMEVFRLYPSLAGVFDHRLLLAEALEKSNLKGEAIAEYGGMTRLEGLTPAQQSLLQSRIAALRK